MASSPASVSRILQKNCRVGNGFYRQGHSLSARRLQTQYNGKIVLENEWAMAGRGGAQSAGISSLKAVSVVPITKSLKLLCKAEANVSGDFPNHAPAGMSQYERIVELLTTLFPVWV